MRLEHRPEEGSTKRGYVWCVAALLILLITRDWQGAVTALAMGLGGLGGVFIPDGYRYEKRD